MGESLGILELINSSITHLSLQPTLHTLSRIAVLHLFSYCPKPYLPCIAPLDCILFIVQYLPEIHTAWENYILWFSAMMTITITYGTFKKEMATLCLTPKLFHQTLRWGWAPGVRSFKLPTKFECLQAENYALVFDQISISNGNYMTESYDFKQLS